MSERDSMKRQAFIQLQFSWFSGPNIIFRLGTWHGKLAQTRRYSDGSRAWRVGPMEIGYWY